MLVNNRPVGAVPRGTVVGIYGIVRTHIYMQIRTYTYMAYVRTRTCETDEKAHAATWRIAPLSNGPCYERTFRER